MMMRMMTRVRRIQPTAMMLERLRRQQPSQPRQPQVPAICLAEQYLPSSHGRRKASSSLHLSQYIRTRD